MSWSIPKFLAVINGTNEGDEIIAFQKETKLGCIAGCGKCCSTPEIDASPLEFLPWAFDIQNK